MVMEAVQEFMDELFDDAEELGSGKYTRYSKHLQSINEQVEGVNTLESTPKVGPPLLYALAGKDLSPPPPAEGEGEAPAEPAE